MASFDAQIRLVADSTQAERSVRRLEEKLSSLDRLTKKIAQTPLDLFSGGRGARRDTSGQASKAVANLVRNFDNFGQSVASVSDQVQGFQTLLNQVNREGVAKGQKAAVDNLTKAWAEATVRLERYAEKQNRAQQNAIRAAKGLQSLEQRELQLQRRSIRVAELKAQKKKQERAEQELINQLKQIELDLERKQAAAQRRRTNAVQGVLTGAGFSALFGGGPGEILGGALGGLGGLGTSLFGSVLGRAIDDLGRAAAGLGQALTPLTADLDAITQASGDANTEFGQLISELSNAEQEAGALDLATRRLASVIGEDGVTALRLYGDEVTELQSSFAKLFANISSGVAKLINQSGVLGILNESFDQAQGIQTLDRAKADFRGGTASDEVVALFEERAAASAERRLEINAELISIYSQQGDELEDLARSRLEGTQLAEEDERIEQELLNALKERQRVISQIEREEARRLRELERQQRAAARAAERDLTAAQRIEETLTQRALSTAVVTKEEQKKLAIELRYRDIAIQISKIKDEDYKQRLLELAATTKQLEIEKARRDLEADRQKKATEALDSFERETQYLQDRLRFGKEEADIRKQIADLVEKTEGVYSPEELERRVRTQADLNSQVERQLQLEQQIEAVYREIGSTFVSVFDDLINSTKSFNDILSSTLRQLSSFLLQAGFSAIGNSAAKGSLVNTVFGTRAMGGPVSAGQPYIVGERRPELFVPNQSGQIYPSVPGAGGPTTVNVVVNNNDGASTSESDAGELGRMIESSVMGVIQREKRPGGTLS